MNVLLIEPDKILVNSYISALEQKNIDTQVCTDAQTAIEMLDNNKPDAIIMEILLSPLSGVAFLNELRSYEDFIDIPVIINSSVPVENFDIDIKQWQRLGVIKYFYKARNGPKQLASFISGLKK